MLLNAFEYTQQQTKNNVSERINKQWTCATVCSTIKLTKYINGQNQILTVIKLSNTYFPYNRQSYKPPRELIEHSDIHNYFNFDLNWPPIVQVTRENIDLN